MLAIALNYQIVIGAGSLVWRHRGSGRIVTSRLVTSGASVPITPRQQRRRRSRRSPKRRDCVARQLMPVSAVMEKHHLVESAPGQAIADSLKNVVALNAAETIGNRAVRLALRGDYHAASSEFLRALRTDSTFDLARCGGFWGMQPAGYVAAARADAMNDRVTDAKSLLTVVKLSCGTHRELERLLDQVVTPIAQP
jgi:hypothetical protein